MSTFNSAKIRQEPLGQFATSPNDITHDRTNTLEKHQKQLTKLHRKLAKMQKGSNRYIKQETRITKLHKRMINIIKSCGHTNAEDKKIQALFACVACDHHENATPTQPKIS